MRLRLSRKLGFDLQEWSRRVNGLEAVDVARPGRFGNPFTAAGCRDAGWRGSNEAIAVRCVEAFRAWVGTPYWRENWDGPDSERARARCLAGLPGLRGKNLACWCAIGAPCHADVLIELANR